MRGLVYNCCSHRETGAREKWKGKFLFSLYCRYIAFRKKEKPTGFDRLAPFPGFSGRNVRKMGMRVISMESYM
jgi:hypothetical protein